MKRMFLIAVLSLAALLTTNSCNGKTTEEMTKKTMNTEPVMGLGQPVADHFTGEAWLNMLSAESRYDCNVYNVTFAPAARNYWHAHAVGQILLCTQGVGFYQEKGKAAVVLRTGDVVNIPPNTVHWHGAAPYGSFSHIGITPKVAENEVEWLGEVTDEEYNRAVGQL